MSHVNRNIHISNEEECKSTSRESMKMLGDQSFLYKDVENT